MKSYFRFCTGYVLTVVMSEKNVEVERGVVAVRGQLLIYRFIGSWKLHEGLSKVKDIFNLVQIGQSIVKD